MNRIIRIGLAIPQPVPVQISKTLMRHRTWNSEKLVAYLREGITPMLNRVYPDVEVEVVASSYPNIQFQGWKPPKVEEAREAIGEMIGAVMEDIDPEEYLSA